MTKISSVNNTISQNIPISLNSIPRKGMTQYFGVKKEMIFPQNIKFKSSFITKSKEKKFAEPSHTHKTKVSLKLKKKSRTSELKTAILEGNNRHIREILKN